MDCYSTTSSSSHTCGNNDSNQNQFVNNNTRKFRPFDVENLIKESAIEKLQKENIDVNQITNDNQNIKAEILIKKELTINEMKQDEIIEKKNEENLKIISLNVDKSKDCVILYPGVTINSSNNNFQIIDKKIKENKVARELINLENVQEKSENRPLINSKIPLAINSGLFFDSTSTFMDRSAEVKHARTPINTNFQQTHSPQLPAPSPNYPVQTQLSSDFGCSSFSESALHFETKPNDEIIKPQFNRETVIHVPNITRVPTINNNYMSAAPFNNQNEIRGNSTFWDLHLPHSTTTTTATVQEQESLNNITIKDLLTNNVILNKANANETLNNQAAININKVNTSRLVKVISNSNLTEQHTNLDHKAYKVPNGFNTSSTLANSNKLNTDTNSCIVLNVPSLNYHQPPIKKQRLSKIDIATRKRKLHRQKRFAESNTTNKENKEERSRKMKKERIVYERITTHKGTITDFGVQVFGYSDSSTSSSYTSSECESDSVETDFYIKSSTPREPDLRPEKLTFLQLFGLTTYTKKNAVELSKLERRKWQPKWDYPAIEEMKTVALDLPVPSASPSVLNTSHDYRMKTSFFQILGLQTLPSNSTHDYEDTWLKIVEDRLKRKCESAVTQYSLKVKQHYVQKQTDNKISNGALEPKKYDVNLRLPNIAVMCKQKSCQNSQNKKPAEKRIRSMESEKISKCITTPSPSIFSNKIYNRSLLEKNSNKIDFNNTRPHFINNLQSQLVSNCWPKLKNDIQENKRSLKSVALNIPKGIFNCESNGENKMFKNAKHKINYTTLLPTKGGKNHDVQKTPTVNLNMPITPIINKIFQNHKLERVPKINFSTIEAAVHHSPNYEITQKGGEMEIFQNPKPSEGAQINHQLGDENFSGLLKAHNSKMALKTPTVCSSIPSIVQPKDCKSTYIQTESNYMLPLAMIVVDNRSLQQGIKEENDAKIFIGHENKKIQCVIKEEVVNQKVQCIMKEEVTNKKVQCAIKEKINNTSIQCTLETPGADIVRWPGINKIMESYHLHNKECDAEVESLNQSLTGLKEDIRLKQTESRYLERKRRALQSASFLFEQDRTQLQKTIENLTKIINAFR